MLDYRPPELSPMTSNLMGGQLQPLSSTNSLDHAPTLYRPTNSTTLSHAPAPLQNPGNVSYYTIQHAGLKAHLQDSFFLGGGHPQATKDDLHIQHCRANFSMDQMTSPA